MTREYVKGIDISRWNGNDIDWAKVAASGQSFVFIKVTDGSAYKQVHIDNARIQAQKAKAAGLKIGYYHFAHPTAPVVTDANNEAAYFLKTVATFPKADFPLVLDFEDEKNTLSVPDSTTWVKTFLEAIGGGIFYSYAPYANSKLSPVFASAPLWLASYPNNVDFGHPVAPANGWDEWQIWQYSQKGTVPGIPTPCDLNIMDKVFFQQFS